METSQVVTLVITERSRTSNQQNILTINIQSGTINYEALRIKLNTKNTSLAGNGWLKDEGAYHWNIENKEKRWRRM